MYSEAISVLGNLINDLCVDFLTTDWVDTDEDEDDGQPNTAHYTPN